MTDFDYYFEMDDGNQGKDRITQIWGKKRPHLDLFLQELSKIADIAIWSASSLPYVEEIIKVITPELKKFEDEALTAKISQIQFVFDNTKCCSKKLYNISNDASICTKPLRKVWKVYKQYNRYNTIIVDDTPTTYSENYGNALPIPKFYGARDDQELLLALEKLKTRLQLADVRLIQKLF